MGPRLITELQRQKYERHFGLYDRNQDGIIHQSDVKRLVEESCEAFGVFTYTFEWRQVSMAATNFWRSLEGHVDSHGDEVVTKQEWVSAHEDSDFVNNVAIPLNQMVFDLGDLEGDGLVSKERWGKIKIVFGTDWLFEQLDTDRDGHLSSTDFAEALRAFYWSNDENVANHLMGPLSEV